MTNQQNNSIDELDLPSLNQEETVVIDDKMVLAGNIAFFRKKLGLSQTQLANKLQYSNKNI